MKWVGVLLMCVMLGAGISICYAEDPDYGNDPAGAEPITSNYQWIYGDIGSGDEDWFTFTPSGNETLRVWLGHPVSNWMTISVYQEDQFGTLVHIADWSVYNNTAHHTYYLEHARPVYLRVFSGSGTYGAAVELVETVTPDSYSNSCASPTVLPVDTETQGTLEYIDSVNYDTDWFVFDTQPLHMYRVQLWYLENCWVNAQLYTDDCASMLWGNTTDVTLVSWYGDSFRIYLHGDSGRLGNRYTLLVTDLGEYLDDYENTYDVATTVPTDGTDIYGSIDYETNLYSDEDWFTFTPVAHSKYQMSLRSEENNWRNLTVYQENEFGDLVQVQQWSAYGFANPPEVRTMFFEYDRPCYVKLWNATGGYYFDVEFKETFPPDSYSNDCANAEPILTDGVNVYGTLDHPTLDTLDVDWFTFETEPLHMYQVELGHLNNSSVSFRVYNSNCVTQHWGDSTNMTLVSWNGDDFNLYVHGGIHNVGNYYWIRVTDLGLYPDDHPNTWDQAQSIPKNNTEVEGIIQYIANLWSDEDWFTFTAGMEGNFDFTLNNPETNWKDFRLFQENDAGQPVQIAVFSAYNHAEMRTYYLMPGKYWIKVSSGSLGDYLISMLSPEPYCGDLEHPYPPGDANKDCYITLVDVAMMATGWLTCTDPQPPCNYLPLNP